MVQFKTERIPEILGENLNPNFLFLNLNPSTASKSNKEDITTIVVTWLSIFILISICFALFKVKKIAFAKEVTKVGQ